MHGVERTVQSESPSQGEWELVTLDDGGQACQKPHADRLVAGEVGWHMYETQSDATIEWLSTDRNTLEATSKGVDTLAGTRARHTRRGSRPRSRI